MCDITKEKLSENILQKRGLETIGWKEERDKIAKIELIKLWTNFKTFYDRYIHWVLRATILNGSGHLTPWERVCSGCICIRQNVIERLSEEQYNLWVKNVDQVGAQGKVLSTTEVACRRKPHKSWSSRLWVLRSWQKYWQRLNCTKSLMLSTTRLPGDVRIPIGYFNAQVGNDNDLWKVVIVTLLARRRKW